MEPQYSFVATVRLRKNKNSISGIISLPQPLINALSLKHGEALELGIMQIIRTGKVKKE